MNKAIDYFFGDLSAISTNELKLALQGFKLGLKKSIQKNEDAFLRIEGELLNRKDVVINEKLFRSYGYA